MGREVLLRYGLYQRSPLLSLVRDPGKLRMKLAIGVGRGGVGGGTGTAAPLKTMGKGELVTLATHPYPMVRIFKTCPGKRGALFLLLCPTYLSASPTGRGKAKRASVTGRQMEGEGGGQEWEVVRGNVSFQTIPDSGILE